MSQLQEAFREAKQFISKRKKTLIVLAVLSKIIKAAIVIGLLYFPVKSDSKPRSVGINYIQNI